MKEYTIWNHLKDNWSIKKSDLNDMNIDPDEKWENIKLHELGTLADYLDTIIEDLI